MECKLILSKNTLKANEGILAVVDAEVEIKNISKQNLIIEYRGGPFEYLVLLIIDPDGKKISDGTLAGHYSPFATKQKLKLGPGETYRHTVPITGNSDERDWKKPGVYKITAIYEYKKEKATSKEMNLMITLSRDD